MSSLSIETWRRIVSYHPLHFWQLVDPQKAPVEDGCMSVVRQYSWQSYGAVGRDEIQRALDRAEAKLADYLGYAVGARAVTWPDLPITADGVIRLPEGRLQSLGSVSETLLGTPAITLSDADGDGLTDTFTATFASALTSDPAGTIVARFAAADQIAAQRDDWRIWPVRISTALNGLTYDITVRGPSAMLVKPAKYEGMGATLATFTSQDAANYVSSIALWQQTIDTSAAVRIGDSSYSASAIDARLGIIQIDPCAGYVPWCSPIRPRATVSAIAGVPLGSDGDLARDWQPIVAQLAAAEISGTPCACTAANHWLYHWQFDISRVKGGEEEFAFKDAAQGNPFGTRRGQVAAWLAIREHIQPRGFRA